MFTFKYRVVEYPANEPKIVHEEEFDSEFDVKKEAERIVRETHNTCKVQRFNGEEWQLGNRMWFWYFSRVCFYQ